MSLKIFPHTFICPWSVLCRSCSPSKFGGSSLVCRGLPPCWMAGALRGFFGVLPSPSLLAMCDTRHSIFHYPFGRCRALLNCTNASSGGNRAQMEPRERGWGSGWGCPSTHSPVPPAGLSLARIVPYCAESVCSGAIASPYHPRLPPGGPRASGSGGSNWQDPVHIGAHPPEEPPRTPQQS